MPAGVYSIVHVNTSNPGHPSSAIVGTSGSDGSRVAVVTASARSLPAFTCGEALTTLSIMIGTWPAITSISAGPLPLYGTCSMSMPAARLKSSMPRWDGEPLPIDA